MTPDFLKVFSGQGLYREIVAVVGGSLALMMFDILNSPNLIAIPNWTELGYLTKLIAGFILAYSLGEIMLFIGRTWFNLVSIRLNPLKFGEFKNHWIDFFTIPKDGKKMAKKEEWEGVLSSSIVEFIHKSPGLRQKENNFLSRIYINRILISLVLFFIANLIWSSTGLLHPSLLTLSISFVILVVLTLEALELSKEFHTFHWDAGLCILQNRKKRKSISKP